MIASFGRGDPDSGIGVDSGATLDGVVIRRPVNRPQLAYAMLLRRLTIGEREADVVMPGFGPTRELARFRDRWLWRMFGQPGAPWQPVRADQPLDEDQPGPRVVAGMPRHG